LARFLQGVNINCGESKSELSLGSHSGGEEVFASFFKKKRLLA
jgi:hypothetical protein